MSITTPLLSYLQNSEKIGPMLAIEVPTDLGRTYQGYKRGGKIEARERICEETLGGVVWLFGVKAFNKGFDFIGKNILGLKDLDVSVGRDSLRNPASYITNKPTATAAFKFSKIIASSVLGILTMGIVVPKLKQAMTNAFRMKDGLEPIPDKKSKDGKFHPGLADKFVANFIKYDKNNLNLTNAPKFNKEKSFVSNDNIQPIIPSMDEFLNNTSQKNNPTSFKGNGLANALCYASYNLENNTAWRLLSTDIGTLSGRVATSRNKKEGIEYLTRDSISSVFYIFAAPVFSGFLRKITDIPDVNPKGAEETAQRLKDVVKEKGGSVSAGFFTSKIPDKNKQEQLIKNLKFEEDETIKLSCFNAQTNNTKIDRAKAMSELQPMLLDKEGNRYSVLSKKQAVDVLSDSYTSEPVFLKNAISKVTNGKSDDPKAFVSRKKLEKIRDSFDEYTISLEKYAKRKGKDIDASLIDKYTKKLNRTNLGIHIAGMAFAVLGLAVLIPKFQYWLSAKITGTEEFPGTMDYYDSKTDM